MCEGPQLGMQWRPSSGRAWDERSSGGMVDEKQMEKRGGVSVVVMRKRVAVGRTAGGFEQAVGICCC